MKIVLKCTECDTELEPVYLDTDLEKIEIKIPLCKNCLRGIYNDITDAAQEEFDEEISDKVDDIACDHLLI
jgi:NAD-dependent SIR2 family protein deacetylase